jgi:hypothetical protein
MLVDPDLLWRDCLLSGNLRACAVAAKRAKENERTVNFIPER